MKVTLAKTAGFCFGVQRAVQMVHNAADQCTVYTYGPIIHNETVVADLAMKGVQVITSLNDPRLTENTPVVIRSHGISYSEYEQMKTKKLDIIDATCPFVKKIHKIVQHESKLGQTIVIIGNPSHPEVQAIRGWSKTPSFVIETIDEANKFQESKDKKLCIVSQTTFNYNKFQDLVEILSKKGYDINCLNTICNATEERQNEARRIAASVDGMIVIGGKHSSNSQKLYEISQENCTNTCYIQTIEDIDLSRVKPLRHIGITAGASTPNKIIEEVYEACLK